MRVWRITKKSYASSAFSGEGGLRSPGRWHHVGHRIVYTSESLALASIETWVHVSPSRPLPDHVQLWVDIPDDVLVHDVAESNLPAGWRTVSTPQLRLRDIGTHWLQSRTALVARVPAAPILGEFNYLINPEHSDFERLRPGNPQPFVFDARMWKKRPD